MLQEVRLIATDVGERIVRCGGRDQRVEPGGTVEAFPGEVERMVDQETVWEAVGDVAERPTLEALRERASELDIAGRSKMDRDQLEQAVLTVETTGGNAIGATGDPEAIAEANRIAEHRGDSPTAFGIEAQDDAQPGRSSEDVQRAEVEPGAEPEPQQVADETRGTVAGGEQAPPAEVPTGADADLEKLSDDELRAHARDRATAEGFDVDELDRDEILELLKEPE